MKEYKVKRERIFCPMCEEEHEVILIKKRQINKVKECEIENDVFVYVCEKYNEEFEDGELLNINLMEMRDAYRRKNNLLTKDEIISIREKYGITQEDLSNLLGLGEKTIARYETNTIQDKPYDVLLRKFNEDYNFAYDMLYKAKTKFNEKKFLKIRDTLKGFISLNSESIYNEIQLKNKYIFEDQECSANGFRLLSVDKIKSIIAYFAKFTKNLFSVKLMKLLWYSDALSYQRTGKSMTGLVYTHMPMGALPIGYKEICELNSIDKEPEIICETIRFRFIPKNIDMINESLFTLDELNVLQEVCERFGNISGTELSEIMHEEEIYKETEEKQVLDFSLINKLKAI